jgi:hypothetical protein
MAVGLFCAAIGLFAAVWGDAWWGRVLLIAGTIAAVGAAVVQTPKP